MIAPQNQRRNRYQALSPTAPAQPVATSDVAGRTTQAGDRAAPGMFSNGVTYDMLGTGQWGTGQSLQGAGRVAALKAIRDARTTANPADYAAMGELRDHYLAQLADLPGSPTSSFNNRAAMGIGNVSSAMRSPMRGMGASGYAGPGGQGASRQASDYVNALLSARAAASPQANQINRGLGNVQAQDMKERSTQLFQAQSLAEMINRLMSMDQDRQDDMLASAAQRHADRMNLITGIVSPLAEYATSSMVSSAKNKDKEKAGKGAGGGKGYTDTRTGAYDYDPDMEGYA